MITIAQIKEGSESITQGSIDKFGQALIDAMVKYAINTPARISAFLAQIVHESNGLRATSENLKYSYIGLRKTFPKYFPNDIVAKQYEWKPEKIANKVYANRMGNSDEASGDGWKYRGRGPMQITGHDNYAELSKDTGNDYVNHPELLEQPVHGALSAAWFWSKRNLNKWADINTLDSFKSLTRIINNALLGLEERTLYWNNYKKILGI